MTSNTIEKRKIKVASLVEKDREIARLNAKLDEVITLIPTTWLDPLLSGKNAVITGNAYNTAADIERLLKELRQRVIEWRNK